MRVHMKGPGAVGGMSLNVSPRVLLAVLGAGAVGVVVLYHGGSSLVGGLLGYGDLDGTVYGEVTMLGDRQLSLGPDLPPGLRKIVDSEGQRIRKMQSPECERYMGGGPRRVRNVQFTLSEVEEYARGSKSTYHNADFTDLHQEYTKRMRHLPKDDFAGKGSCAIVFSSGSLLRHEFGAEIDGHDEVVRFNWAPVQGFEKHVGSKTTVLAGGLHITKEIWIKARLRKDYYDRRNITFLVGAMRHYDIRDLVMEVMCRDHCGPRESPENYDRRNITFLVGATRHYDIRDLVMEDMCRDHCGPRETPGDFTIMFPSDDIQRLANKLLCEMTVQGRYWIEQEQAHVPTSGLVTTLMMLHVCESVDVYGADFVLGRDPYHYWSSPTIPLEYNWPETVHWFSLEHALYEWWAEKGLLRLRGSTDVSSGGSDEAGRDDDSSREMGGGPRDK